MGVTLGVLQNSDHWFGEGDDMIFIDDESSPPSSAPARKTISTAHGISAGDTAVQAFAHLYNGAPSYRGIRNGRRPLLLSTAGTATTPSPSTAI